MSVPNYAYATLLTRASYLSGVLILAHTLRKHSDLPLIVLYTPSLSPDALRALELESKNAGGKLILKKVEPLVPEHEGKLIAERFRDTWTKLRVFELWDIGERKAYDGICYLDADVAIFGNIDEIFAAGGLMTAGKVIDVNDPQLRPSNLTVAGQKESGATLSAFGQKVHGGESTLANTGPTLSAFGQKVHEHDSRLDSHSPRLVVAGQKVSGSESTEIQKIQAVFAAAPVCCCNLDNDSWAPADWTKENCPYTKAHHYSSKDASPASKLLNSGVFVFQPSQALWDRILIVFYQWSTDGTLDSMKFPDQDFLGHLFGGQWRSLNWRFNALKTMKYWHPKLWHDKDVVALHYIVDKPWAARVGQDGKAGYLGKDGETHGRWWREWHEWEAEREKAGQTELLELARKGEHVAGYEEIRGEDMKTIGSGAQDLAKGW